MFSKNSSSFYRLSTYFINIQIVVVTPVIFIVIIITQGIFIVFCFASIVWMVPAFIVSVPFIFIICIICTVIDFYLIFSRVILTYLACIIKLNNSRPARLRLIALRIVHDLIGILVHTVHGLRLLDFERDY